jgi:hypothetical protein
MRFLKHHRETRGASTTPPARPPHDAEHHADHGDDAVGAPIAGVSLELYVAISRSLATVGFDASKGPEMAALEGIDALEWGAAVAGWNARMHADPTVARRFNTLYTQR